MTVVPEGALAFAFNDVNKAYPDMQEAVRLFGVDEQTRNGRAKALQVPITVTHYCPWNRVLFDPLRDANPFFHYMEALWMLAGSENVDFPAHFAKNIRNYSDDGITLHGAYGYRWRAAFERDQLEAIQHILETDTQSRRLVVSMWDPHLDLERDSKDVPCNTQLYFRAVDQKLTLTILNRSNDLVWGMLGANIVHMSILQEYLSNAVSLEVGPMYQFSNNVHVYDGWGGEDKISDTPSDWYRKNLNFRRWKFGPRNLSIDEAQQFVENWEEAQDFQSRIMRDNVTPMYNAWRRYKANDLPLAIHYAQSIYDEDWSHACVLWLMRRIK